jgi:hypothetical protein
MNFLSSIFTEAFQAKLTDFFTSLVNALFALFSGGASLMLGGCLSLCLMTGCTATGTGRSVSVTIGWPLQISVLEHVERNADGSNEYTSTVAPVLERFIDSFEDDEPAPAKEVTTTPTPK